MRLVCNFVFNCGEQWLGNTSNNSFDPKVLPENIRTCTNSEKFLALVKVFLVNLATTRLTA